MAVLLAAQTVPPAAADPGDDIRSAVGTLLPRTGIASLQLLPVDTPGAETPDTPNVEERTVGPFGETDVTVHVQDRTIGGEGYVCVDLVVEGQPLPQGLACQSHARLDQLGVRDEVPRMSVPVLPAGPVTTPGREPIEIQDVEERPAGSVGSTPMTEVEVTYQYSYDCESMPAHTIVLGVPVREPVGLDAETLEWIGDHGSSVGYVLFIKVWQDGELVRDDAVPIDHFGQAAGYGEYLRSTATGDSFC